MFAREKQAAAKGESIRPAAGGPGGRRCAPPDERSARIVRGCADARAARELRAGGRRSAPLALPPPSRALHTRAAADARRRSHAASGTAECEQ